MSAWADLDERVSPGVGTNMKRMVDLRRFLSTDSPAIASRRAASRSRRAGRGAQQRAGPVGQRRRADAQHRAEIQGGDHPQRDRLAVQQAVARSRLQSVTDGVTEVQDRPPARLALVGRTTSALTRTARAMASTMSAGGSSGGALSNRSSRPHRR